MVYYNENNVFACRWLQALMDEGLIARGIIDCRAIRDVTVKDIQGFNRVHLFAGIGGWELALQLAGWPINQECWAGSCPCQPFSISGHQLHYNTNYNDPNHLWPTWYELIKQHRPATIFGEQVANKTTKDYWLSEVRSNLEAENYAVAINDLSASGFGALHQRQRYFFVAHSNSNRQSCRDASILDVRKTKNLHISTGSGDGPSDVRIWDSTSVSEGYSGKRYYVPDESTIPLLVNGIPSWMEQMRGYGNAIVPQVAAQFIASYLDVIKEL